MQLLRVAREYPSAGFGMIVITLLVGFCLLYTSDAADE